jgi:hypothetical protein
MFTVVCGVLFLLLIVVFIYYKNALNKEKEKCDIKLKENIKEQKIICNNEKEALNKKLTSIYKSIDNVMDNLNDEYKFSEELTNLNELKAKLEAVSSIIPTKVSIEELREKVNTLENDVQNKIENKKVENNPLNPVTDSMTNVINTMISIYIKQFCNKIDSKVRGYETYNINVDNKDIRCDTTTNGQCKVTFNTNKYLKNKDEGFLTGKLEDANTVYDINDICIKVSQPNNRFSNFSDTGNTLSCIPRENLFVRVSKPVELDQTNFEKAIEDLQKLRQKPLEEQQNSAKKYIMLSQIYISISSEYGIEADVEKVIQYYVDGFIDFDPSGNPTIKYDELITFMTNKREQLCNKNLVQDYPLFTGELVDRVFESYMKIN